MRVGSHHQGSHQTLMKFWWAVAKVEENWEGRGWYLFWPHSQLQRWGAIVHPTNLPLLIPPQKKKKKTTKPGTVLELLPKSCREEDLLGGRDRMWWPQECALRTSECQEHKWLSELDVKSIITLAWGPTSQGLLPANDRCGRSQRSFLKGNRVFWWLSLAGGILSFPQTVSPFRMLLLNLLFL